MIDETKELVTAVRHNELEFPSEVAITYANVDNDYQIGTEYARRITAKHENVVTINLPIALTPAEAAKIAEIALNSAWYAGRFSYSFATNYSQLILSPGDLVSLPLNTGNTEIVKITSVDYGPTGMITYEAIPDLYNIYSSNATGTSGITYITQSVEGSGPTKMELLDCCMLRDEDTTMGWYSALSGYSSGWPGGVVLKSSDGGATWDQVSASTNSQVASIGITSTLLSNADCRVWDKTNTVTVKIFSGNPLYSATEVNVLNGANAALIGSHGRWELIQWLTATLNGDGSYTLSNLLRGRKGTEWAASLHTSTDSFIALNSSTIKNITIGSSELNATKQFKAVTTGQPIESVNATDYTYTGVRLKPLAPVYFSAVQQSNKQVDLKWSRRDRIAKSWSSLSDLPQSETSERYEIDVIIGGTVKRTLTSTTTTATYNIADVLTDTGGIASATTFNLYQISSVIGRGYATTTTVNLAGSTIVPQITTFTLGGTFVVDESWTIVIGMKTSSTTVPATRIAVSGDTNLTGVALALATNLSTALTNYGYGALTTVNAVGQVITVTANYGFNPSAYFGYSSIFSYTTTQTASNPVIGTNHIYYIALGSGTWGLDSPPAGYITTVSIRSSATGAPWYSVQATSTNAANKDGTLIPLLAALQAKTEFAALGLTFSMSYVNGIASGIIMASTVPGLYPVQAEIYTNDPVQFHNLCSISTTQLGVNAIPVARPQITEVTIAAVTPPIGAKFNLKINSTTYTYTISGGDTANIIGAALVALVNADGPMAVTAAQTYSSVDGYKFALTGDVANTPFTIECSASQGGTMTIATTQQYSVS